VGVFAPAKVDDAVAKKLNAAINEIVAEPATEARLRNLTMLTSVRSLADTESYFRSEVAKWGKMVEAIGIVAK
jgi:tripartite-type tricarboxylate transporter receptor subunit TctC